MSLADSLLIKSLRPGHVCLNPPALLIAQPQTAGSVRLPCRGRPRVPFYRRIQVLCHPPTVLKTAAQIVLSRGISTSVGYGWNGIRNRANQSGAAHGPASGHGHVFPLVIVCFSGTNGGAAGRLACGGTVPHGSLFIPVNSCLHVLRHTFPPFIADSQSKLSPLTAQLRSSAVQLDRHAHVPGHPGPPAVAVSQAEHGPAVSSHHGPAIPPQGLEGRGTNAVCRVPQLQQTPQPSRCQRNIPTLTADTLLAVIPGHITGQIVLRRNGRQRQPFLLPVDRAGVVAPPHAPPETGCHISRSRYGPPLPVGTEDAVIQSPAQGGFLHTPHADAVVPHAAGVAILPPQTCGATIAQRDHLSRRCLRPNAGIGFPVTGQLGAGGVHVPCGSPPVGLCPHAVTVHQSQTVPGRRISAPSGRRQKADSLIRIPHHAVAIQTAQSSVIDAPYVSRLCRPGIESQCRCYIPGRAHTVQLIAGHADHGIHHAP